MGCASVVSALGAAVESSVLLAEGLVSRRLGFFAFFARMAGAAPSEALSPPSAVAVFLAGFFAFLAGFFAFLAGFFAFLAGFFATDDTASLEATESLVGVPPADAASPSISSAI